jgi:hypothetical protein
MFSAVPVFDRQGVDGAIGPVPTPNGADLQLRNRHCSLTPRTRFALQVPYVLTLGNWYVQYLRGLLVLDIFVLFSHTTILGFT